ncbi:acidic phospholipase A2 PA4-like [Brevipalpus obovatus]|uniref:acidic phospholipase A2 PA4-like n=1 Tax=Brevipalpus obovatus TaxID=246614 RepID=UPI003D9DBB0B
MASKMWAKILFFGYLIYTVNASQMESLWSGIVPGTKWCGLGNQAKNFHDLGSEADVDRCCRAHDHCPRRMEAFEAENGVINFSLFTRSHCECDESFYNCLKSTKSPLADIIGNLYFNILQIGCLDYNYYRTNTDCQKNRLSEKSLLGRLHPKPKVKFYRNQLLY